MNYRLPASLLSVVVALLLVSQCFFIVPQGNWGVVHRMQSPLTVGLTPGLHVKVPFLDSVTALDAGGIALDGDTLSGGGLKFATAGGETLQASYFAVWHITDPAVFCAALACDEEAGARRLNQTVVDALVEAIKAVKADVILADQPRFTAGLAQRLNPGIARLGLRFERIDLTGVGLPPAGLDEVYTHMRSAQQARAAAVRAEGAADAARSRAATDAERERILAAADAAAARTRAAGEAEAAGVDAQASRQDPDFFSFYRGLAAYRRGLAGQTVWVLDSDSPFLKYLKAPAK